MSRRMRVLAAALTSGLLTSALLAGCGNTTKADPSETPSPTPVDSSTPSDTPTPSQDPAPSTEPSPSAPSPTFDGHASRLLPAADLPGFNDEWTWADKGTTPVGPTNFGRCAEVDMLSIGAMEGSQRRYVEAGDPSSANSAAMQVLDFPDAKTAERATKVLEAWHRSCAARVKKKDLRIGAQTDVSVPTGTAFWYLLSWTKPGNADDGHFHAFGVAVNGTRMALLSMDNDGQDRNYDDGKDPMELAVAAAAQRLG